MCVRVSTETDLIPNSLLSFSSLSGNVFWAHFTEPRVKKWQRRMAETLKKSLRWLHHGNQHERNLRDSKPIIAVPSWSSSSGISKKNTTRDVGVGTKNRHSTWWSKVNGRKFREQHSGTQRCLWIKEYEQQSLELGTLKLFCCFVPFGLDR